MLMRSMQEFAEISQNPPAGISVSLENDNVHRWNIVLQGPEGSAYVVCYHLSSRPRASFHPSSILSLPLQADAPEENPS